ncbi:MAG TPA: DEAD/DEAH box helicase [Myxococcota bacterium]|nr:DEAD/DEAH box helicase [Myxococcota bacterium]HQK51871.1 DEAD/DEAH box helicase [Myxococcota bacterium]
MMDPEAPGSPVTTFEALGLDPLVLQGVRDAGYQNPLPVQTESFAPAREGRHVVVQSRTGSGKTAAFVLPLLHRIDFSSRKPQVLVLAPTRELALQVHEEFQRLGRYCGLLSVCIYGGTRYQEQLDALASGVQVVVGTPGRVLDHQRRGTFRTADIRALVLDEADEMLSAGFYEDIRKVLAALPGLRQVLLFSATLPEHLMQLIGRFMPNAVRLDLSQDRVDVDRIENVGYPVDPTGSKLRTLLAVLEAEDPRAAIVFCNTRAETERVTAYLRRRGFDAALLNSDLSQTDRERVMARMRSGRQRLLVATDIAARGIDISFLPCVIHFDLPQDVQQYIHRTGRTGRVDRMGRAISLLTITDTQSLRRLEWTYGIRLKMLETPSREETLKMLAERRVRELKEMIEAGRVIPEEFLAIAREILEDPDAPRLVASLVDAWLTQASEEPRRPEPSEAPRRDPPPSSRPAGGNGPREGGRRRRR